MVQPQVDRPKVTRLWLLLPARATSHKPTDSRGLLNGHSVHGYVPKTVRETTPACGSFVWMSPVCSLEEWESSQGRGFEPQPDNLERYPCVLKLALLERRLSRSIKELRDKYSTSKQKDHRFSQNEEAHPWQVLAAIGTLVLYNDPAGS
ncbi:hypothetical protein VNO77_27614 [Canavalia gladiata]|uniref:Uncharacterized protein n=1 Tax=Canavalia gladiata TaxID=3824 RepID=A0AAN9Q4A5_CANGL